MPSGYTQDNPLDSAWHFRPACGSIMMPDAIGCTGTSIASMDKPSQVRYLEKHKNDFERKRATLSLAHNIFWPMNTFARQIPLT
jgi:hypothetical protein